MAASADRFSGIPLEAFEFYEALEADNTRPWWLEHKSEYQRVVREPLELLLAELSDEFGPARLFRPYRDARFSKDKSLIKDHQGCVVEIEDAIVYYVQVSSAGLMSAAGWYAPQGQQLARYREAVDGPVGVELERIVGALSRRFEIEGRPMRTRPRGFAADHPRIELLRNRQLTAGRRYPVGRELGTRTALTMVRRDWRAMRPLVEWLADYVGPASDPSIED